MIACAAAEALEAAPLNLVSKKASSIMQQRSLSGATTVFKFGDARCDRTAFPEPGLRSQGTTPSLLPPVLALDFFLERNGSSVPAPSQPLGLCLSTLSTSYPIIPQPFKHEHERPFNPHKQTIDAASMSRHETGADRPTSPRTKTKLTKI